jgi:hypothetical protein
MTRETQQPNAEGAKGTERAQKNSRKKKERKATLFFF